MGRKEARTVAMHCLYQMDIHDKYTDVHLNKCIDNSELNKKDKLFALNLGINYLSNSKSIDISIQKHLNKDWKLNRLSKVELAILRLSITEMLYIDDVPNNISINEAVELSKKFSDNKSSSFVNGVLGSWLRSEVLKA